MLKFNFIITNPWKEWDVTTLWLYDRKLSKNKSVEAQLDWDRFNTIIDISVRISHREDHAGIMFEVGLLGLTFIVNFYDSRHWDYDTNTWEVYPET